MAEYDLISFNYSCLNMKQNALKVYINTFYSEAENSISCVNLLGAVMYMGHIPAYILDMGHFGIYPNVSCFKISQL